MLETIDTRGLLDINGGSAADNYYLAEGFVFAGLSIAASGAGALPGIIIAGCGALMVFSTWIDATFNNN